MNFKSIKSFGAKFLDGFNRHDLTTLAAALAFYTALSLAPLLLITVSILGILGGESQAQLVAQIQSMIGEQAGETIKVVIEGANERHDLTKIGGIIGVLPMSQANTVETSKGVKYLEIVARIPLKSDYAMFPDGKKLHKQVMERLPNEAVATAFNF